MNDVGQDGGGQGAFEHEFKARVTFAGGGLTANDVRVAQYLQEHLGDLPFLAADEVADSVGVSRAAVVRLARRLGYPSFAAMRDESRRQFRGLRRSPLSRFARSAAGSGPLPECGARKFEEDVANLQATWTMVAERLGPAAKDLALAPRAFITGNRNSYGLAMYFHRLLRGVRANAHLLDPGFPDEIADLTPDDLLIVVLFHRYSLVSVRLLERATRVGATTIAITDGQAHPFLRDATHVLAVASDSPVLFQSMVAAVAVLEALAAGVAEATPAEAARLLVAKEQLAAEGAFFYRPPGGRAKKS